LSVYEKPLTEDVPSVPESAPGAPAAESQTAAEPPVSAAIERFKSCRWRKAAENGIPECCGHRDVLPMTGTNGFDPEAWCPGCAYYKLRRTPKKRDYFADRY
jgi:hypothetical protein